MQKFPDSETVSTKAASGKFMYVLKIIVKGLSYITLTAVLGIVIGYNYVMRPTFLKPLIVEQFAKQTNGTLEIDIKQASLFRGFKFSNIVVHPPNGFSQTPIVTAREINLLYNVFGFFRGKFGVHEIALKDLNIHLEQKNDVLNLQALLKPGEATKQKEKEEIEKVPSETSVISWFFDVQLFARFILENFNFTFDAQDASNKVRQYAHLKKFTFNFAILTKDFSSIDTKDPAALV